MPAIVAGSGLVLSKTFWASKRTRGEGVSFAAANEQSDDRDEDGFNPWFGEGWPGSTSARWKKDDAGVDVEVRGARDVGVGSTG